MRVFEINELRNFDSDLPSDLTILFMNYGYLNLSISKYIVYNTFGVLKKMQGKIFAIARGSFP